MGNEQSIRDVPSRSVDRAIEKAKEKAARRRMWGLILVVFFAALLISIFVNIASTTYEQVSGFSDPTYRPMDIIRKYEKLDELRRKGL